MTKIYDTLSHILSSTNPKEDLDFSLKKKQKELPLLEEVEKVDLIQQLIAHGHLKQLRYFVKNMGKEKVSGMGLSSILDMVLQNPGNLFHKGFGNIA